MKKFGLTFMIAMLAACNGGENAGVDDYEPSPAVVKFQDDAVALLRRDERDVESVNVQYVLVGVGLEGSGGTKPELSLIEAEEQAAAIYGQALDDENFDTLVLENSYGRLVGGQRPGTFTLVKGELPPDLGPATYQREQEETSLWKGAWRLKPGETGAIEFHEKDANQGFYVVRVLTDAQMATDDPANFPAPNKAVNQMRQDADEIGSRDEVDADKITVQHILIARWMSPASREGKILRPNESEALAAEVWAKVKSTDDFTALVREYSFDNLGNGDTPGKYVMHNRDEPAPPVGESLRKGMVKGFGDTAWKLKVGEVGVSMYDRADSPYGYHIIKRLE